MDLFADSWTVAKVCSSHFSFLVTFAKEVTKILSNLCLHFARQDGLDGKNRKENHTTLVTKIHKKQERKKWDARNIR